jgi:concanavalin A-like lectin/glucanase superfamily protein
MVRNRLCLLGAVMLVAACSDRITTPTPPGIEALIRDGSSGVPGVNPHFFFLWPIRPFNVQLPKLAPFNPGLSPVVEICKWNAAKTACAMVRQITMTTGSPLLDRIHVLPDHEEYAVLWVAKNLILGQTYRIRVLVGGAELGYADLDVVKTINEFLKYPDRANFVPVLQNFILPIRFRIEDGALLFAATGVDGCRPGRDCAEAVLDPTKDNIVITKNQKAGIFIPQGAFLEPITLVIEEQTERPCILPSNLALPQFTANRTGCYLYKRFPSTVALQKDLIVGMCVDIGGLTHAQADRLQIFRFDTEGDGEPVSVLDNASAFFLTCDATRPRGLGALFNGLSALFAPRPLHAATSAALIHLGVGGVCALRKCLSAPVFTWGIPGTVTKHSADPQTAAPGNPVAAPPSVLVTDLGDSPQPLAGVTVTFQVTGVGGTISALDGPAGTTVVLTTNSSGIASLDSWTLGSTAGSYGVQALVAGAAGSPVTFSASTVSGLLLHYTFDGNVNNTGLLTGFDGTATNVTFPAGKFSQAIKFDGTAGTGAILTGTRTVFGSGSKWTISLWFREDAPAKAEALLWRFRGSGQGWETYHGVAEPGQRLITCSDGGCLSLFPATDAWHNLVYRYDGPSPTVGAPVDIYVDGAFAGRINDSATPLVLVGSGVTDIRMGNAAGILGPSLFYMDDFRVYNQVFTDADQCVVVVGGTWSNNVCTLP